MNLPNRLTLLRILLIPFFMFALLRGTAAGNIAAVILFAAASLTDFADGYIARKYQLVTTFGKFADPLADKLLVTSALLIFLGQGRLSSPAVFLILAREFTITALRTVAMGAGRVMAAAKSGKIKTATQMICIIGMIVLPVFAFRLSFSTRTFDLAAGWCMALVSLWSGIDYLYANRDLMTFK